MVLSWLKLFKTSVTFPTEHLITSTAPYEALPLMPLKPSRGSTDGITASEDNVTLSRLSDEVKDVDSPTYDTASRQNGWDPETASAKTYEDAPLHRKLKSRHLTMIAIGTS